jgi:pimeloyl-ACP methyl ester carboxylesterase
MSGPSPVATVLLLPGLDGTARLFARFLAEADGALELVPIPYPPHEKLGYAELEERVRSLLPTDRPFALLGESFSGPLALRIAASSPRGLIGLVLATTFVRRPAAAPIAALRPLAPAFFRLPLPRHVVRLLLAGGDAPAELVEEVRAAVGLVQGRVMAARAAEALHVDASDALRRCPVPILVISGRRDRLLRRSIPAEVKALRPDAEIHLLDAPHLVLQCRPREAMRWVSDFVVRLAREDQPATASPGDARA